jgi:hypothetical protein
VSAGPGQEVEPAAMAVVACCMVGLARRLPFVEDQRVRRGDEGSLAGIRLPADVLDIARYEKEAAVAQVLPSLALLAQVKPALLEAAVVAPSRSAKARVLQNAAVAPVVHLRGPEPEDRRLWAEVEGHGDLWLVTAPARAAMGFRCGFRVSAVAVGAGAALDPLTALGWLVSGPGLAVAAGQEAESACVQSEGVALAGARQRAAPLRRHLAGS